jgi:hypothetical protein
MPPVNGTRDPFNLPGVPGAPLAPTPADILNNRGYGHPREDPGVIPSVGPLAPPPMSPEMPRNAKVVLPKLGPRPPFPSSSWRRWIWVAALALGAAFRAMVKERRNNA